MSKRLKQRRDIEFYLTVDFPDNDHTSSVQFVFDAWQAEGDWDFDGDSGLRVDSTPVTHQLFNGGRLGHTSGSRGGSGGSWGRVWFEIDTAIEVE